MKSGKELMARIGAGESFLSIGVWDVLSARVVEAAGIRMIAPQSFQVAAARGLPDIGILTPSELLELCARIAEAVDLPQLVDFESGFGGPGQAAYWARLFERAGVAAVHVDDEGDAHSCPWLPGAENVLTRRPARETEEIISRMADARQNGLVIVARAKTRFDTKSNKLLTTADEDIERLAAYVRAGADMVFAPQEIVRNGRKDAIKELSRSVGAPVLVQFNPPGYLDAANPGTLANESFADLFAAGVSIINIPQVYPVAYRALLEGLRGMAASGSAQALSEGMLPLEQVLQLLQFERFVSKPQAH